MRELLLFTVLGLGLGAGYALAALGVVLVYRGSGVLNFAHGAMGMVGAYVCYELRVNAGWPAVAAVAVGVAAAAALGLVTGGLVMRRLRTAAPLTRLIATLGILLFLYEAVLQRYTGKGAPVVPSLLPTARVELLDGVSVGADRLILLGLAVAVTAALAVTYRATRFGLATTATAENERALATLGWSPARIATLNWTLGAALGGVAAVVISSINGLSPTLALLVIPAFAAALVGGFTSFPLTLAGALGVGVAESLVTRYVDAPGWGKSMPFLVIVALLVLRGQALPVRGAVAARLPRVGTGRASVRGVVVGVAVAAVLLGWVVPDDWVDPAITSLVMAIVLLSIVVVTGLGGQLSLAQYTLAGIGAWVATRLAVTAGLPFGVALAVGALAMVPIAAAVGLPALRTRGANLAVVTFAFAFVLDQLVLTDADLTGGPTGTQVDPPSILGYSLDGILHPRRYAIFALVVLALVALVVANVRRGRSGRRMLAVRANERAATALGISVVQAKLYAFVLAGVIAGIGGVVGAYRNPFVEFDGYGVLDSIQAVALAVIGGIGYVAGAPIGSLLATGGLSAGAVHSVVDITNALTLVAGLAVVAMVMLHPDGVASVAEHLGRRRTRARGAPAQEPPPVGELRPVAPATLVVEGLSVRFGIVEAVRAASFSVGPGEVVGLIGPNGAGKTTLVDAITGFTRPVAGAVALDGVDVTRWPALRRARAGLGRCFQSLELFEDMTVEENLLAAAEGHRAAAYVTDLVRPGRTQLPPAARAAIEEFRLGDELPRLPGELTAGRRRLVAIARAAAAEPSVLLLDEPAAGLDTDESAALGHLIRRLADRRGMAVVLVEHDVDLVFSVCDRVVVLEFGQVIADGPAAAVARDERVVAAYLGNAPAGVAS